MSGKFYRGFACPFGNRVHVVDDDTTEPLNHIVRHSPDGFTWGYHGSGPAELAHCLLVDHLGHEVEPAVYQAFKAAVIAAFPADQDWIITSEFVDDWLRENDYSITETDVLDEEVEQMSTFVRCECCNHGDTAERMVRDSDGAWLCWPCSRGEGR